MPEEGIQLMKVTIRMPTTIAPRTFCSTRQDRAGGEVVAGSEAVGHGWVGGSACSSTLVERTLAISTVINMPPAMPSHMVAERITPALEQE